MYANTKMQRKTATAILGGGGFIGGNLAEHLLQAGHSVISVSKSAVSAGSCSTPGVEHVVADLADPASYASVLELADQVVYLASATTPGSSTKNPMFDVEANLMPFLRFLELNTKSRKPVIFASSGGTVYGKPQYVPIDEEHPTEPISPYGIVKLTMEKYLSYFSKNYGFKHIILRIANPYGGRHHRHKDQGVIDVFAKKVLKNEELVIWGSGAVVRDYVHIADVCNAFEKSFAYQGEETVFNIGSGHGRSVLEIVDALCAQSGRSGNIRFEEGRDYDIRENVLDISRAKAGLGWAPSMAFDKGLAETLRNIG